MIRFFLDTDDDFDVSAGLDISEEILNWSTVRQADRIHRAETEGMLEATLRFGRSLPGWWREGRLIEGRVGDFVFFRGFILDAAGAGFGQTKIRAMTWAGYLAWRGSTPDVVGLTTIEALRTVFKAAAAGLPGALVPSGALIERIHDEVVGRRLYWRDTHKPLYWRSEDKPLYWRHGPIVGVYAYGFVGDTDTVGNTLLVGPPRPAVVGDSAATVDRLTAVEYDIENYEYGRYLDEMQVLAAGERGWIFSGGGNDVDCLGRVESAAPSGAVFEVMQADFGRFEYEWHVGAGAIGQVAGRAPDLQPVTGVIYRQENVFVPAGVSSWRIALRDRGRPAEAVGGMAASWSEVGDLSVAASALAGDLLIEVFNNTGAGLTLGWIEVSGRLNVYQGGEYADRVSGRYGGSSVELRGVFGGAAGLSQALDYWGLVTAQGGPELRSVTLDGRRFSGAWGGQIGGLLRSDALAREGASDGATDYWIVGVRGAGAAQGVSVTYDLMRYVEGTV